MTSSQSTRKLIGDPCYGPLKLYLIEVTGLAYYLDKDEDLARHLARRLMALGVADCGTYLRRLLDGPAGETELGALTADLTIGETFFFRHRELFNALRDRVFPELIERNRAHRRLRIWSAGCATGAEPYTLAILLGRELGPQLAGWDITILGTDINREFLAHAQRGEFSEWSFRSAPDGLQESCFSQTGQMWLIAEQYRRGVSFQYHNLVQHPFPSPVNNLFAFDLIMCRNVMIYFDARIVRQLLSQFHESLVDGGWFAVGHSEPNVESFRAFQTINQPGVVLYRKEAQMPAPNEWVPPATDIVVTPPLDNGAISTWSLPQAARNTPEFRSKDKLKPAILERRQKRRPAAAQPSTLADIRAKLDLGELDEAAECCQKMMATERLNPLLHFYRALISEQMGNPPEAEQALRGAIYLDRNFVLAHYYLGLVLQRNRDTRSAERSFRNVIELLNGRDKAETFSDADGLTVEALRQLTEMHLEVLKQP